MTTGKTIALTIWIFVDKVLFLLFNTLPRFVTAFPPRRKCLLISWLQLPSAVMFMGHAYVFFMGYHFLKLDFLIRV